MIQYSGIAKDIFDLLRSTVDFQAEDTEVCGSMKPVLFNRCHDLPLDLPSSFLSITPLL
jgi:hypothetical protein